MADALIVGRTMDVNALAAVGCAGTVMSFIIGFAQGITSGFSIITAQRFGSGDLDGVCKSFVPTLAGVMELCMRIFTALILAHYLGFAGASASNPLAWVGALIPLCTSYLFTMRRLLTEHDPGRGPDDTHPEESPCAV